MRRRRSPLVRTSAPASPVQGWANRLVDGIVEAISPRAGKWRRWHREQSELLSAISSSTRDEITTIWSGQGDADANAYTLEELPDIRRQSRYAAQRNPIARAVRRTLADHVIGNGVHPKAMVDGDRLGITPDQVSEFQAAADQLFADASRYADSTGRQEWVGLQHLVFLSVLDGGDVFPSFPMVARPDGSPVRVRINLIEAERVETPLGKYTDPKIRGGVQLDSWGAPEGFWVARDHPGDRLATRRFKHEFWPTTKSGRTNVLQVYSQDRIGQARGLPLLHAALPMLEQVAQYVDSTVLAAEIQTRLSLWIKTQGDPEVMAELMRQRSELGQPRADYGSYLDAGVEAGSVNLLNAGDELQTAAPTSPGQYFDPFVVRLLRMIGSCAGGVPYEIFANDVGSGNYSSIRAGLMGFRKTVHRWQAMVVRPLDVYRRHVIYEAWLDGKLLPGAQWLRLEDDLDGWMACTWTPPALGWIDPTKEVRAYAEAVKERFMSRQEVISSIGGPGYRAVARQLAEEQEIDEEVGLSSPVEPQQAPPAPVLEPEPDSDEDQEDDSEEEEIEEASEARAKP